MARLGTKRVSDILDYERDIKGKGLVRLRSGVGSGKNYWVRHLPEKYPDLQILMITSRKNVAEAEAIKLDTDTGIPISQLIDTANREWYEDFPGSLLVCTNAYIEYFLKNIFDIQNPTTHLWNKFDVIFVDEAHSLCSDASFADSSFHVAQFILGVRKYNPRCDIVLMSGTQEPIDWVFSEDFLNEEFTLIDIYDTCIHLAPDKVSMMKKEVVPERIFNIWSHGKRLIYFANTVASMADLITKLKAYGIPEKDMAIAYSNSPNADSLPQTLVSQKNAVREHLVTHSSLPPEVKIFITTSQNKEGVSIEDDDIKYMFSENHNKADLEQMAGRVRGNPDTGTGIHMLVVVYDAEENWNEWSFLECELDRILVGQVENVLSLHESACKRLGKEYTLKNDISSIQKKHLNLRYYYISKQFLHFIGREKCEKQTIANSVDFDSYIEIFDEILYYYSDHSGSTYAATGRSELRKNWFPYSTVYSAPDRTMSGKEEAAMILLTFLQNNNFINVEITSVQADTILAEIRRLIVIYGKQELGFRNNNPQSLKPALKKFNINCESANHHNCNKIITLVSES